MVLPLMVVNTIYCVKSSIVQNFKSSLNLCTKNVQAAMYVREKKINSWCTFPLMKCCLLVYLSLDVLVSNEEVSPNS